MRVLDLFAGLGGWSAAARDRGHDVRTLDLDPRFGTTYVADILETTPATFGDWRPDLVLASPPCERFSVLRIGRNWTAEGSPRNDGAALAVEIVAATIGLIAELAPPRGWVIENPRGKLRVLPVVAGLERRTVTYCQLGHPTMKPTDLWGGFPAGLVLPPMCRPSDPCHIASPRGSSDALQGSSTKFAEWCRSQVDVYRNKADLAAMRALVPFRLGELVVEAAEQGGLVAPPAITTMRYQMAAGL